MWQQGESPLLSSPQRALYHTEVKRNYSPSSHLAELNCPPRAWLLTPQPSQADPTHARLCCYFPKWKALKCVFMDRGERSPPLPSPLIITGVDGAIIICAAIWRHHLRTPTSGPRPWQGAIKKGACGSLKVEIYEERAATWQSCAAGII